MKFLLTLPIRFFPSNRLAACFYFVMSILALTVILIQPYMIIQNFKSRDIYADVKQTGTMTISPVYGLEENKDLFIYIANLATFAMLNRNPNGLDNEILFKTLFLPECREQIKNQFDRNQALFTTHNVHQKCEAGKFHILKIGDADGQIMIRSLGQLILAGISKEKSFTRSYNFVADFTLIKNQSLKKKGLLPYVVTQVNFKTIPK